MKSCLNISWKSDTNIAKFPIFIRVLYWDLIGFEDCQRGAGLGLPPFFETNVIQVPITCHSLLTAILEFTVFPVARNSGSVGASENYITRLRDSNNKQNVIFIQTLENFTSGYDWWKTSAKFRDFKTNTTKNTITIEYHLYIGIFKRAEFISKICFSTNIGHEWIYPLDIPCLVIQAKFYLIA